MNIPSYLYKNKFAGIYCIENTINHKRYIGSSLNLYQRLHSHKVKLSKNKHENGYLQNAVNKYGIDNFESYMIELVENTELLTVKEQYWINKLNSEYNLTKEVIRNVLSQESRDKISKTLKEGYINGNISKTKVSPVDVYDLDGNYIRSFPTIRECGRELGLHVTSIIRVLNGQYSQVKGYQVKYSKDLKTIGKITLSKYNHTTQNTINKRNDEIKKMQ